MNMNSPQSFKANSKGIFELSSGKRLAEENYQGHSGCWRPSWLPDLAEKRQGAVWT